MVARLVLLVMTFAASDTQTLPKKRWGPTVAADSIKPAGHTLPGAPDAEGRVCANTNVRTQSEPCDQTEDSRFAEAAAHHSDVGRHPGRVYRCPVYDR